jgi:hypothetical protein
MCEDLNKKGDDSKCNLAMNDSMQEKESKEGQGQRGGSLLEKANGASRGECGVV